MPRGKAKLREDLLFLRDSADPHYFFVKDPIRAQFFRFNELQVAMMKAFDGRLSVEEIAEKLSDTFETEIPEQSVQRMLARMEKDLLLDVSSYRLHEERDRRLIRKELRNRGLVWRSNKADGAHPSRRKNSKETALFESGIHEVEFGDPCKAGGIFAQVAALNPHNERAKAIVAAIHEAYFKRYRARPSNMILIPFWNPDQFLGALDKIVGRWLFSAAAPIALVLLALISIEPLWDLRLPPPSEINQVDVGMYIPLLILWLILHELGHGLTCKHYGGTVSEIGLVLIYGVSPGAYCDTSDTYLFPNKWHKIITSLAGVYVSAFINFVMVLVFSYTSEVFFLRNAIVILLFHTLWLVFTNLVPFIKLDGYYALAEFLEIRNLRERAFRYVAEQVQHILFGIRPTEEEKLSSREKRIFVVYGVASMVWTTFFIYGLWISYLLPLAVKHLGTIGLLLTCLYAFRVLKKVIIAPAIALAKIVGPHRKKVFTWKRMLAFTGAGLAIWGLLSIRWPFYVDGQLIASPLERVVVHAEESGLVDQLLVLEGARVETGQVLAVMRNGELRQQAITVDRDLAVAKYNLALLRSGARAEDIALAKARVNSANVASEYDALAAERKSAMRKAMVLSTSSELSAKRVAAASAAEHVDAKLSLAIVKAGAREEDIAQASATVDMLTGQREELDRRMEQLTIRAPISGTVVGRDLEHKLHTHLARGAVLLEIHDVSSLRPELVVAPGDMFGSVSPGQPVALRAFGDPHRIVETAVNMVRPRVNEKGSIVLELAPIPNPGWTVGMSGHGRVYGEPRTIAFRVFGVPVLRVLEFEGWRVWGG